VRGFAVALFACTPVLALTAPAHGDTAAVDPPTDTTTTVPPTDPPTSEASPPPETDPEPTTVPPDTTVTEPVTAPTTDPPIVDATTPPSSTPPSTDSTTGTTTDTTAPPNNDASPPAIAPPMDPPSGGGGTSGGGTSGSDAATASTHAKANPTHDSTPAQKLFQLVTPKPFTPTSAEKGTLKANFASLTYPAGQAKDAAVSMGHAVGHALTATVLRAAFAPRSTDGSLTDLGSAAPRFGPWIVLLAMAWLVRMVIASMLADRTAGPRRRRWTLL
jgi:hypothetical protein